MYKLIASNGETAYGVNEYAVDTPEEYPANWEAQN